MGEMTVGEILLLLKDGGTIAALLLIIVTGMRGDWVWRLSTFPPTCRAVPMSIMPALGRSARDTPIMLPCPSSNGLSAVLFKMIVGSHYYEILRTIIVFIAVQVMDMFARLKRTAKHSLGHNAMLVHVPLSLPDLQTNVLPRLGVASAFPARVVCPAQRAVGLNTAPGRAPIGTIRTLLTLQFDATHRAETSHHTIQSNVFLRYDNSSKP